MAVYPSRMAPISNKLCQNTFWKILDVSFVDVEDICLLKFSNPVPYKEQNIPETSQLAVSYKCFDLKDLSRPRIIQKDSILH